MPTEQQSFAPGQTISAETAGDLSAEIAAVVEKEPGDRVKVTWVAGPNYRCNWWAPRNSIGYDNPGMGGLAVTTHVVRQSRFLNVTRAGGRLVIRDHAAAAAAARA